MFQITSHLYLISLKTVGLCIANSVDPDQGLYFQPFSFNPIALRRTKIACNFGLSECNRINKATNTWLTHRED